MLHYLLFRAWCFRHERYQKGRFHAGVPRLIMKDFEKHFMLIIILVLKTFFRNKGPASRENNEI